MLDTTKITNIEIDGVDLKDYPELSDSFISEPNFVTNKIAWVKWNMKTYNNTLTDALKLLKQKEMIASF